VGLRWERGAVSERIKGSIGEATKTLNKEGGVAILPHGVKIEWIKPKEVERDSFIKDENVVVLLEHHKNDARNLARATSLFVSGGLIPSSRIYVDPPVMKAADLAVTRRILLMNGRMDAVECFNREFLTPAIGTTPLVENLLSSMEQMDSQGTFTRILMREFSSIWARQYPQAPSLDIFRETARLCDILGKLAARRAGEVNVLEYQGKTISIHILPVARDALVAGVDITPHLTAARISHSNEVQTIYVVARGDVNIAMAEILVHSIVGEGLYVVENSSKFHGKIGKTRFTGYAAAMRIKAS
jgi:hypothetical protein